MQSQEARTSAWFAEASLWGRAHRQPLARLARRFGKCNTVFKRFHDGVKADIWQERFDAVSGQPDMQYAMADATIEKVHRHGPDEGLKVRL